MFSLFVKELTDPTVMINKTLPLLCLIVFSQSVYCQTEKFNLSFQNRELGADNTFCVDLALSFDEQNKLGSSNLVFSYDSTILTNPRIVADYLENAQSYLVPTLTKLSRDKASINVELLEVGKGEVIQAAPYKTLIAKICFDRMDLEKLWGLEWFYRGTIGTLVYVDDEDTKLEAETLADRPVVGNPVDFLSLTAVQEGRDARLRWETATNSLESRFEIERSFDEVLFAKVGEVNGMDIAEGENVYEFLDQNIQEEVPITFYYRIKQIELDGAPRYSDVVSLTIAPGDFFTLEANPNPFGEELDITFSHSDEHPIQIRMITPLGEIVYDQSFEEKEGSIKMDTSAIPAGFLYLLAESFDGKQIAVKKVAKIQ